MAQAQRRVDSMLRAGVNAPGVLGAPGTLDARGVASAPDTRGAASAPDAREVAELHDAQDTRPGQDFPVDPGAIDEGAPALVVVLECRRPGAPGSRLMLDRIDEVVVGRGAVGEVDRAARVARVVVGDSEASRRHLAIRRRPAGWELADLGSRNGTLLDGRRVRVAPLSHGDVIEAGGAMLMFVDGGRAGAPRDRDLAQHAAMPMVFRTLNVELERRIEQVVKIAGSPVAVLVRGATGTGKELMARAIHDASGRRGPFVAINCGALPRNLIESELFGHRRGAFSGATEDRDGLVRRAHLGTLFLDEIAELPPDSQVALLRVLQDGEVRPVGASEVVKVDVRIVAATHQDLRGWVASGRFRQDLYARIAGFDVELPALRDRREDLGLLIGAILDRVRPGGEPRHAMALSKAAARVLLRYGWPLNIRELEQTLRSAVALCEGREIELRHLPEAIRNHQPGMGDGLDLEDRHLRERVIELLRETGGNISAVGRALDRAPNQIRRWCRRLQIDVGRYRSHELF
jgi:DNA-binding NtrC family response regulator